MNRDDANNYDYDCGRCGQEFNWEALKSSNWMCPYCGWDSVRMSPTLQAEKSYGISTKELLEKYGGRIAFLSSHITYQMLWDNLTDNNIKYHIRRTLIRIHRKEGG